MLRTVTCDDEFPALELLTALLKETNAVEIVASCQSVYEALEIINKGGIDLAVFDIEMPKLSGVEAFGKISVDPKPLLIFATAHPEYALEAFEIDAIDYLLKPLDRGRVHKAVEKASRLHKSIQSVGQDRDDALSMAPEDIQSGTLRVKDSGHVYFIAHADVVWVEAAGDYSLVHTPHREYALRRTIKTLEEELPKEQFVRVHRSAIVSVKQVSEVELLPKGEAQITMRTGSSVRASRSYRDTIRKFFAPK